MSLTPSENLKISTIYIGCLFHIDIIILLLWYLHILGEIILFAPKFLQINGLLLIQYIAVCIVKSASMYLSYLVVSIIYLSDEGHCHSDCKSGEGSNDEPGSPSTETSSTCMVLLEWHIFAKLYDTWKI